MEEERIWRRFRRPGRGTRDAVSWLVSWYSISFSSCGLVMSFSENPRLFTSASFSSLLLACFWMLISSEFDDINSELPVVGPCDELSSEGLDVVAS